MLIAVIVVVVILVVAVLYYISKRNSIIASRNRVDESWSGIDVQLKRRHDLVPNLVETVKGYASHESEVFEKATKARAEAMSAHNTTMTLQFSKQSDTKRVYYWILSAVGCYGAMATAGITGARSMRMHQVYDSCSAAAPSDWSRDDIDNYCLRGIPRTSLASGTSPQSD